MTKNLTLFSPIDGWASGIEEVPDQVFAARLLGDGVAIDPLGDTVCAPADGMVASVHSAGHAVTLACAGEIEILIHFGLETVGLGGQGFTPLVNAGDRVTTGTPLLTVDLAAVAPRAKSLVTPIVVTRAGEAVAVGKLAEGRVTKGQPMLSIVLPDEERQAPSPQDALPPDAQREVRIILAQGLHARPSARLSELARQFEAKVEIHAGDRRASLRSPTQVMALSLRHGDTAIVTGSGREAQQAVAALCDLLDEGMGEAKPFPAAEERRVPTAQLSRLTEIPRDPIPAVTAAPGFAIGVVTRLDRPLPPPDAPIATEQVERDRLNEALVGLKNALKQRMQTSEADQAAIAHAHLALLDDEAILAAMHAAIGAGSSARLAWRETMAEQTALLRAASDPHIAQRADDLVDLEWQLHWYLAGTTPPQIDIPEGAIVIARDLVPSQVIQLDPKRVAGIATALGGPTSHVAIIAANLGIPTLVAAGEIILAVSDGASIILDADAGRIELAPSPERVEAARAQALRRERRRDQARANADLEGRTRDGCRIEVFANLGSAHEARLARSMGAEGCGLLRTEFLFLDRAAPPNEAEQHADYAAIAQALDGRPVIIRLLDVGGDKPAPYLPFPAEENPALGWRGIRVGLGHPELLRTQIRAILRASAGASLGIMVPMVAQLGELRAVREVLDAESAALGIAAAPQLGIMVETPACAMMADQFAAECDFLSIGTNDLTQYALAMDRGNPIVAAKIDGFDPAILRLIDHTCQGARRHGKWVGVCGGLASDPLAAPLLIGLGVTELSTALAQVAEIKALVRSLTVDRCRELARKALLAPTAAEVRQLAAAMLEELMH